MIQIYADNTLVSDSRLEKHELVSLQITAGLNVGGTATIVLPREHPAYNAFTYFKTVVTIFRDGELRFRGRALYPADNAYGERTIVCEGELCFLRDSISRPYAYDGAPTDIFYTLILAHNSQVEEEKQLATGLANVTVPTGKIQLESDSAESTYDTLNKLLDQCGGYIVFTSEADGTRVIHWLQSLDNRNDQTIVFGENLLDFSSTGANNDTLATAIVPYGARNEETKSRLTIASVNDGKDYLLAQEAIAQWGTIFTTVTWDEVTDPAVLLSKAKEYLNSQKLYLTSLTLTALDLSYLDKNIDSFKVGDNILVVSPPHSVYEYFPLTEMTEDLLNPEQSSITMGKDVQPFTVSSVNSTRQQNYKLNATAAGLTQAYSESIQQVVPVVESYVLEQVSQSFAPTSVTEQLAGTLATEIKARAAADQNLQTAIDNEVTARAGAINKVNGTVHISGGAPISILGGKIDISGSEINFGKEARFLNESGIRIADKDGNFYYVLRVDTSNSCVVGNDYCNLYLRGKDAVYLYKTGAVVTSDQREKNSVEALPEAYMAMLDKLAPMRFKYNGKGDRYHVGFIAQDVERAMAEAGLERDDFGGFVDLAGDGTHLGLAYDEFIGLLLQKIRRLEERIEALEE